MPLDDAMLDQYFAACAPGIGRTTMAAIVKVESAANPWALHDNTRRLRRQPGSYAEAVGIAKTLIARGHSVDIGLGQVNSRNLGRLGMSVEEVLEPCRNLIAASAILKSCYAPARSKFGDGQKALIHALSCYNTGSLYAGRSYVDKILAAANAHRDIRVVAANSLSARRSSRKANETLLVNFSSDEWRMFP